MHWYEYQLTANVECVQGNDLISLIMEIEEDGDVLTEEELYAQCVRSSTRPLGFGGGQSFGRYLE